ncbi:SRPBCC family protein [Curtobacterium pusillum]|uniref:SRPBCC family protein n=1 Tax=Curtobacterium pusillum TaxID=69373 RepID=UPI0011A85FF5|nr:SRPBCC family protein [Curtobacterium pusillum]
MPATTTIERSIVVAAPAAAILPHLADLHRWTEWSPWEGQDPDLHREYGGEPGTVGSTYAWKGNRKAGAGDMRVTGIAPHRVDIDLRFTAPFRSSSTCVFRLDETGAGTGAGTDAGTRVVWMMTSPRTTMSRIVGTFINMDKLIGGDFDKGLAQLKAVVER